MAILSNGNGLARIYQAVIAMLIGLIVGLLGGTSSYSPVGNRIEKLERDAEQFYARMGRYSDRLRELELLTARHHPGLPLFTPRRDEPYKAPTDD